MRLVGIILESISLEEKVELTTVYSWTSSIQCSRPAPVSMRVWPLVSSTTEWGWLHQYHGVWRHYRTNTKENVLSLSLSLCVCVCVCVCVYHTEIPAPPQMGINCQFQNWKQVLALALCYSSPVRTVILHQWTGPICLCLSVLALKAGRTLGWEISAVACCIIHEQIGLTQLLLKD